MGRSLMTVAAAEFTAASRLWWIRLLTLAFGLLTVAMAQTASIGELRDGETFARLTVALLPLALLLVPLAALLVGVSSVSATEDTSGFLLSLPLSATDVIVGRWLGQAGALGAAIGLGFGTGGVLVWASPGSSDVARFVVLIAACLVLALAFLSIATLVAVKMSNRGSAVGVAAFIWFVLVLLYDAAALTAALWLTGRQGARLLFASVFANVVDLVRILTLTLAGTPHILGAAGESWTRALGGGAPVAALAATVLMAWIVVPVAIAARVASRGDQ